MALTSSRRANLLAISWLALMAISSCTQKEGTLSKNKIAAVDSVVAAFQTRNKVPGMSVAIGTRSEITWEKAYGMADLEDQTPAKTTTVYRLASISKSFTGVAVMQLVERGKIDLDAPVQKYVPSFPVKKFPITTRQVLGHLSGIHHYLGADEFNIVDRKISEGLELFMNDSLHAEPGTKFIYSSYGYNLLGAIVEQASGEDFNEYVKNNIFSPAGMDNTLPDNPVQIIPNRSRFYDITNGKPLNAIYINTGYRTPAGGMLSTTGDLERFMFALWRGALVKPASLDSMTTPMKTRDGQSFGYGFGLIIGLDEKFPGVIWHGGVQPGCTTSMAMLPEKDISVVVLTNEGTMGSGEIVKITSDLLTVLTRK
ncbi:MAG TPA: serine hydrolase domain-containing protein [Cyclobacteriaceae bacterium]|nr:serine hydrolase domain-containing protein [Cyclobacteriaceae bacterium]